MNASQLHHYHQPLPPSRVRCLSSSRQRVTCVAGSIVCVLLLLRLSVIYWPLVGEGGQDDHDSKPPGAAIDNDITSISVPTKRKVLAPTRKTAHIAARTTHQGNASSSFSIVMLSYRSPKSLAATLRSLHDSKIMFHPQLQEVIVYFQVFSKVQDITVVRDALSISAAEKDQRSPDDAAAAGKKRSQDADAARSSFHVELSTVTGIGKITFSTTSSTSAATSDVDAPNGGLKAVTIKVIGDPANLPVAKATFRALQSVTAPLVMYLECDRPSLHFPDGASVSVGSFTSSVPAAEDATATDRTSDDAHHHHSNKVSPKIRPMRPTAWSIIDTAITMLSAPDPVVDVFRLQLYANPLLKSTIGAVTLPVATYGKHDPLHECSQAPTPTCMTSASSLKHSHGHVYYTAYCKHWKKLVSKVDSKQQDLCDSFCFTEWMAQMLQGSVLDRRRRSSSSSLSAPIGSLNVSTVGHWRKFEDITFWSSSYAHPRNVAWKDLSAAVSKGTNNEETDTEHTQGRSDGEIKKMGSADVVVPSENFDVICLTSEDCNWTNQPTMYRLEWYQQHVQAPCERAAVKDCVGVPGRKSAVLQEQFFSAHTEAWSKKKHRVCLHRSGLFYHNEVDNRER